ncbi:Plasmodium exported protein, unknown function [Plasmodium vivax]|nr:unnamed protein product [Plasmodium vivax]SCO66319.1 Plasmodium exported protein, unknown function [Plasmodium vivax]SCO71753.1 Plasmodium exported protein, unknown function [Plasmodium vivax]VUZ94563.1 Plasmodium exported protein, unknown function [Plasmodium vivax]
MNNLLSKIYIFSLFLICWKWENSDNFMPLGDSLGKVFHDKSLNGRIGRSLFQRQHIARFFPADVSQTDLQYYEDDFVDDYDEEMYDESATEYSVDNSNSDMYSSTNSQIESTYERLNTARSNNSFLKNYKESKLKKLKELDSDSHGNRSFISKAKTFVKKLNIQVELELLDVLSDGSSGCPFAIRGNNKKGKIWSAMHKYRVLSPALFGTLITLLLLKISTQFAFVTGVATIFIIAYLFAKVWKCQNIVHHAESNPEL